jgi:hypothetical protein
VPLRAVTMPALSLSQPLQQKPAITRCSSRTPSVSAAGPGCSRSILTPCKQSASRTARVLRSKPARAIHARWFGNNFLPQQPEPESNVVGAHGKTSRADCVDPFRSRTQRLHPKLRKHVRSSRPTPSASAQPTSPEKQGWSQSHRTRGGGPASEDPGRRGNAR